MSMATRVNDPDLRQQMAHEDLESTAQGLYIIGADGRCYGWMNSHESTEVKAFLEHGLDLFAKYPPNKIQIQPAVLAQRFSSAPYPSTLVVRVFSRIRPVPANSDDTNNSVGRDHLWILAEEAKQIAAHTGQAQFSLPSSLVARLVRYHLIDNVRGEPDAWNPDEVKRALFTARMVADSGAVKTYEFHGDFAQRTSDNGRGIEGAIDGRFEISKSENRASHFRAFAKAIAWGSGRYTQGAPAGRFGMVFALIDVNDTISKVVPPEFMGEYGSWDEYLKPETAGADN